MAPNRVLYLLALIASVFFFFASNIWASWVLLVLVAALPWISLLFSLPAMLSSRVHANLPEIVETGEKAMLHIRVDALRAFPMPEVRIRLNLRTRDTDRDIRFLSRLSRSDGVLPAPTQVCGFLAPELRRGKVYDYLGLFRFPMRSPKMPVMAILPMALRPEPMPDMEQLLNLQLKPKPGGGYAEVHDNRTYQPGDPVKDIHWKLSLKTDELIVREAQEPIRRTVILAVRTPRGPEQRAKTLGNLRYLSQWLLERGIEHSIFWMDGERMRSARVLDDRSLISAIAGTCLAPEGSLPLPDQIPQKCDWLCRVGKEGDGI